MLAFGELERRVRDLSTCLVVITKKYALFRKNERVSLKGSPKEKRWIFVVVAIRDSQVGP